MSYFKPSTAARNVQLGLVVFQATLGVVVARVGSVPYAAIVFVPFHAVLAALAQRSIRREHRRTQGDRGDHDPVARTAGGDITVSFSGGAVSYASVTGTGTNKGTGSGVDLPVRQSDEPIRAWKNALIMLCGGVPMFKGITGSGSYYQSDDRALCNGSLMYGYSFGPERPSHEHFPPVACTCGFYALAEDVKPVGGIILEVELYGRVIVCEKGYRAERQRVLGVALPRRCANAMCVKDATLFAFIDDVGKGLCDEHAAMTDQSALLTPASISDLAGVLGTEVRWTA